ncbi:MAG: iron-containing redox enzyme family protein, partial [Marmoricola sp.]
MRLPHARGPVSRHVIETLTRGDETATPIALGAGKVLEDEDVQLALWTIYELHYRGFDEVPPDREWDVGLLTLRRAIESRLEQELREASRDLLHDVPRDGDIGQQLLDLVAADDSPSPAAFMQRKASREQLVDYLRERSVQQLKES